MLSQNLIILIGVLAGVVVLNIVIATMIILFKRRERYKARSKPPVITVTPMSSSSTLRSKDPIVVQETPTNQQSYLQLMMTARHNSLRRNESQDDAQPRAEKQPKRRDKVPPPLLQRRLDENVVRSKQSGARTTRKDKHQRLPSALSRNTSVRSADSASIYSSSSAAPEFHDVILGARTLETIPASPASPSSLAFANLHLVEIADTAPKPTSNLNPNNENYQYAPQHGRNPTRLSDISEELAPEVWTKRVTWKPSYAAPADRRSDASEDSGISIPIPVSMQALPSTPPLRISQTRRQSRQPFQEDQHHPYAANTSPYSSPGPNATAFPLLPPPTSSSAQNGRIVVGNFAAGNDHAVVPTIPLRSPLRATAY